MREREDANPAALRQTKIGLIIDALAGAQAGCLDEIQGSVANTLKLHRNGASLFVKAFGVGFIVWLDLTRSNNYSRCYFGDVGPSGINGALPKLTLNRLHHTETARYFDKSTSGLRV